MLRLLGGKAIGIYAHAPFFWPPQLTKEQTATSTAHFPKSPTVWRNLHHGLQQHVLATGLLWPHNLLEVGWLKVTHSYPLHHKPKALTESGSAHTECTHRSCWNGVTNSGAGTSLLGWVPHSALATAGSCDISEPHLQTAQVVELVSDCSMPSNWFPYLSIANQY